MLLVQGECRPRTERCVNREIKALIHPAGDAFVVKIPAIHAATQGDTIEDALANLDEITTLALEDEDPAEYGLAPDSSILITIED
jgi:predicted RNase H-like HicB family nuclease